MQDGTDGTPDKTNKTNKTTRAAANEDEEQEEEMHTELRFFVNGCVYLFCGGTISLRMTSVLLFIFVFCLYL